MKLKVFNIKKYNKTHKIEVAPPEDRYPLLTMFKAGKIKMITPKKVTPRKMKKIITLTKDKEGNSDLIITLCIPLETLIKKGYII